MMLGAYYYLWYGQPNIPIVGGGVWDSGHTNQPILGEYNSRDERVISQHIDWAKEAGLDFFIVNWDGKGSWTDITLKEHYLKNKKSSDIKFCIFYDSSLALNRISTRRLYEYDFEEPYMPEKTKGEKLLEDFDYLAEKYFNDSRYLKIDGKAVVFVYNVSSFRKIDKYFDQLRKNMEKRGVELFLVADVVCWAGLTLSKKNLSFLWTTSPRESLKTIGRALRRLSLKSYEKDFSIKKYFRAVSGYNLYGENRINDFLERLDRLYRQFKSYAKDNELLFIPNAMPGYDDRKLKGTDRAVLKREKGDFYRKMFQIARKHADPECPMIAVTSFNEWHEGTEIEPSREEGEKYLRLTKELKNKVEDN